MRRRSWLTTNPPPPPHRLVLTNPFHYSSLQLSKEFFALSRLSTFVNPFPSQHCSPSNLKVTPLWGELCAACAEMIKGQNKTKKNPNPGPDRGIRERHPWQMGQLGVTNSTDGQHLKRFCDEPDDGIEQCRKPINCSDLAFERSPHPQPGSCLWCDSWTGEMMERVRSELRHFTGLLNFHV